MVLSASLMLTCNFLRDVHNVIAYWIKNPIFVSLLLYPNHFIDRHIKYILVHSSKFLAYYGGFAPEFSVSLLKEFIALVWDYVNETRK